MESLFVLILFLIVLTLLWALIPFAVFGVKPRLDRVVKGIADLGHWQKAMLGEIKAIGKQLEKLNQAPKQPTQPAGTTESKSLEEQAAEIREGSRVRYEIDPPESV